MAGTYRHGKYALDKNGVIIRVRIQDADLMGTFNPEPTGDFTPGWPTARISLGRRGFGIRPRFLTGEWKDPLSHPDGYDPAGYIKIVILTKAVFDNLAIGQQITYRSNPLIIVALENERIK